MAYFIGGFSDRLPGQTVDELASPPASPLRSSRPAGLTRYFPHSSPISLGRIFFAVRFVFLQLCSCVSHHVYRSPSAPKLCRRRQASLYRTGHIQTRHTHRRCFPCLVGVYRSVYLDPHPSPRLFSHEFTSRWCIPVCVRVCVCPRPPASLPFRTAACRLTP